MRLLVKSPETVKEPPLATVREAPELMVTLPVAIGYVDKPLGIKISFVEVACPLVQLVEVSQLVFVAPVQVVELNFPGDPPLIALACQLETVSELSDVVSKIS